MVRNDTHRLSKRLQRGSLGGWILIILAVGSVMTLGARLGPLYMDHNTMSSVLDGMAEEPGMAVKGDGELRNIMTQRFKMNNIRDFDVKRHVDIKRSNKGTQVVMDYEVRMPLAMNVDMIAHFNKEVDLQD